MSQKLVQSTHNSYKVLCHNHSSNPHTTAIKCCVTNISSIHKILQLKTLLKRIIGNVFFGIIYKEPKRGGEAWAHKTKLTEYCSNLIFAFFLIPAFSIASVAFSLFFSIWNVIINIYKCFVTSIILYYCNTTRNNWMMLLFCRSQAITNNSRGILHVPLKTVRKYASGEKYLFEFGT